jgi:hypothetical protein
MSSIAGHGSATFGSAWADRRILRGALVWAGLALAKVEVLKGPEQLWGAQWTH